MQAILHIRHTKIKNEGSTFSYTEYMATLVSDSREGNDNKGSLEITALVCLLVRVSRKYCSRGMQVTPVDFCRDGAD